MTENQVKDIKMVDLATQYQRLKPQIDSAMQKVLAMPDVVKAIEGQLQSPYFLPAQQMGERLQRDSARVKEVIEKSGIVLTP